VIAIAIHRRYITGISLLLVVVLVLTSLPAKGQLIVEVTHSPDVPLPGEEVNVTVLVADAPNITFVELQWCVFDPVTLETITCDFSSVTYEGNNTYWGRIGKSDLVENGTLIGYRVTIENTTGVREFHPGEHEYVHITYIGPSPTKKPAPPLVTLEFILIQALLIGIAVALIAIIVWRMRKGLEMSKVAALGVIFLIILSVVYGALFFLTRPSEIELAKDFQAIDTDGNTFNLTDFRGEVVVLDFMSISCGGCEIIAGTIVDDVYSHYDESELEAISIDVSVADDLDALRTFKANKGYPWRMAMDPGGLVNDYAVGALPTVVIIDKDGYAVDVITDSRISGDDMRGKIDDALAGRSQAIGIQAVGGIVLAAFAGFATFFSPCSFPMLPGFVAYYLSAEAEQEKKGPIRVLGSGLVAGIGIILVFLVIGFAWIAAGAAVNVEEYTPILGPIVGTVLIVLGLLMFTNLQYHALLKPFTRLKEIVTKGKGKETGGYFPKLFGYGVGYGAAASACTAPLFIAVLAQSSISGGPAESLLVLFIFSLVIVLLMVVITFMLSAFGQESVRKLSQYTDLIKKVSAVVLVVVGMYLIYYYVTTHVL
jgi:cytochrome c-type biogenesis protein